MRDGVGLHPAEDRLDVARVVVFLMPVMVSVMRLRSAAFLACVAVCWATTVADLRRRATPCMSPRPSASSAWACAVRLGLHAGLGLAVLRLGLGLVLLGRGPRLDGRAERRLVALLELLRS